MRIFALLLLLQTLSHEVFTLKCYKCEAMTTYPNQACLGPTVHSPMETCPEGQVCGVKAHINSFGHHQSRHVVRSCMDRINQTGCTGGHPLRTCIIQCNTDGCNTGSGSSKIRDSLTLINLLLFVFPFLYAF